MRRPVTTVVLATLIPNAAFAAINYLEYIASYPDLIAAFGLDESAAKAHYTNFGQREGRKVTFSPSVYLAKYGDLSRAFGTDTQAATRHFIMYGFKEGRSATVTSSSSSGTSSGSVSSGNSQSYYQSSGITDPNSSVTTSTGTYDLRHGTPTASFALPSTNVSANLTITRQIFQFRFGPYTDYSRISESTPLDQSAAELQGTWINADVKKAWSEGWTGKGVKIGVIDDFTANDYSDFLPFDVGSGTCSYDLGVELCFSSAQGYIRQTHGEQVSSIAAGSLNSYSGLSVLQGYMNAYSYGLYYEPFAAVQEFDVRLSSPVYGIAKDATVYRNDFLTYQASTNGLFGEFKKWGTGSDSASQSYRSLKVVKLSLGGTSTNPVINGAIYNNQKAYADGSAVPDAVFVKAAGNSSCVISNDNCDVYNKVFYNSANFRDKTIFVGALTAEGGRIASYSNKAGTYYDRFLVADGRGIQTSVGVFMQGTSFAAPRVSGYAAILRQKFPNLNAEKSSSILLDTAKWNSSWGTKNTATQAIYGMGEASLSQALAPVGKLR